MACSQCQELLNKLSLQEEAGFITFSTSRWTQIKTDGIQMMINEIGRYATSHSNMFWKEDEDGTTL